MPCLNRLSTGIAHGQTHLISISVTLNAVPRLCGTNASPLHISPAPDQGIPVTKAFWSWNTSGFYLLSALPVSCMAALNGASPHLGLTERPVQLSPCTGPPSPQPDLHYHPSHSRLCLGVFPLHYVSPIQWGLSCCRRLAPPLNTGKTPAHSCSNVLSPPCCHRTSASPSPQFIFSAQPGSQISGCWNVLWRNKHLSHFFSRRWII